MFLQDKQVFDQLNEWVLNEKPFSLLRFGDGEGLFLFTENSFGPKYRAASFKHWGELPPGIYRRSIQANIRKAYLECDVAGLPYDFKGAMWQWAVMKFTGLQAEHLTCGLNIHIYLEDKLDVFIKERDVFYIGCRDIKDVLFQKGARSVEWMEISAQYRFEETKPQIPFYRQVDLIQNKLQKMDFNGRICLLGAGVAGKYFGIIMKNKGGMVLDMGSVFDYWCGVESRSWIKGAVNCSMEAEKIIQNED